MLDVDLLDLIDIKGQNYQKRYLLTLIDVFSRKAYACPIKNKTSVVFAKCFENILLKNPNLQPKSIRTDHGNLKCFCLLIL